MTDFVNRLLGRSEHPSIRPALPTLFEPSRGDDPDDLPFGVFSSAPDAEVAAPTEGAAPAQARLPTPPMPALPAPPPTVNIDAATSNVDAAVSPPPPARDTRETVHSSTVCERSLITSHTETSLLVDRREVVSMPMPVPPSPMTPSQLHGEPGPPQHRAPARVPSTARVDIPQQRPAKPRRTRRDPDVHVTIGRVEIKAAPSTSSGPQRNPAGGRRPKVSLEDYLKAREG